MLAALLLVVVAWRFRLEQYALALPHDRSRPGATTPTRTSACPRCGVLSFALAAAAACLYARVRRVPVVAVAALALAAALALSVKSDLPAAGRIASASSPRRSRASGRTSPTRSRSPGARTSSTASASRDAAGRAS